MQALNKLENCDTFQYENSLNIFSLSLGPFEYDIPKKTKDE